MDLPLNHNAPQIMHIDLNSCFASVEQQAHLTYRHKPLVVAAYNSPAGCVLSPSREARKIGIKVGMTVRDAKLISKNVIVCTPDTQKYRNVYKKFIKLYKEYSPDVTPKSIDEAIIDFSKVRGLLKRNIADIGQEIKDRMRKEIGDWLSCNVGISTNRFLAKTAASLHKPDGLDIITFENLRNVFSYLKLIDLSGINTRFEARLNAHKIFTPLEFLDAPLSLLKNQVFKSIGGYYWYMRLRGWEIDAVNFDRKSFGQEYSLGKKTDNPKEIAKLLMKLCEKMGRRLRGRGFCAHGIHLAFIYNDHTYWHEGHTFTTKLYSTIDLFKKAIWIANRQTEKKIVIRISISCYHLTPVKTAQLDLFEDEEKKTQLTEAIDKINDNFGEFTLTPALMMGTKDLIVDRIAFGVV